MPTRSFESSVDGACCIASVNPVCEFRTYSDPMRHVTRVRVVGLSVSAWFCVSFPPPVGSSLKMRKSEMKGA